jgi:hypothetical protein
LLIVPAIGQSANAIGPYPCFFFIQPLEKVEYRPDEIVTIEIQHCREDNTDTATLYIVDDNILHPFQVDFWQSLESGEGVIHKESKQAVYGHAGFNYTVPTNSPIYRYLILVSPGQMGGVDHTYFFSKENASKIVISDVKILNPEVKQGENLAFGLKVTDGIGNPLPFVVVDPSADYVTCDGRNIIQNSVALLERSEDEINQYRSTGVMWGWLPIPIGIPGTYELSIGASTTYYANVAWEGAEIGGIKFQVVGAAEGNMLDLFADAHTEGYVNFTHVRAGDELNITGKLYLDHCLQSPETSLPVMVEVMEMTINMEEVLKRFGTTQLDYEEISCYKYRSLCSSQTIKTSEMRTILFYSESDFIGLRRELIEETTQKAGEYVFVVRADLNGSTYEDAVGIQVHDIQDYAINEEGKEFSIAVDAWYSNPEELTFDRENKKIILTVDTSIDPKVVEVSIPHELLDGQLTVMLNGEKVIDEQNNENQGGFITKDQSTSYITVFPETDEANIEIVGTTVIPEFPFAPIILGSCTVLLITAGRFLRARN